jgi:hypothetical protein
VQFRKAEARRRRSASGPVKERSQAMGFARRQKRKEGPLILTELATESSQAKNDERMQRGASFQSVHELFLTEAVWGQIQGKCPVGPTSSLQTQRLRFGDTRMLNRVRNQFEDLIGWLLKCEIFETPLDLFPFLTIAWTKR